ncbi:MAG: phosphopentomutase [Gammaproteobacteria bacterium]|nr:phosphopentomutase [Gammaproteobacteria bacterium]
MTDDRRVCILMMDSLGIGASEDALRYGDEKANTLGHIIEACEKSSHGPLKIPNLTRWGLLHALNESSGMLKDKIKSLPEPDSKYGYAVETSLGKDTPSGHWELMGVPVLFEWGYFPNTVPCFPQALIDDFLKETGLPGILGNCHASGTEIIDRLGDEHMKTGYPIVYTSADSVFQIAAHERSFGLDKLYRISQIARLLVDEYNVGRVIARPFIGEPGHFVRTSNRKDYTTPPFKLTLLDYLKKAGHHVISIGKISDIFAHQGISSSLYGKDNDELFDITIDAFQTSNPGTLVFTNFVDFDSKYGHRRDVMGYAKALEAFDKKLLILEQRLQPNDLVFIVADHGCDPTLEGSDHTREYIPVIMYGLNVESDCIGRRESFADVGQTIANFFDLAPLESGVSFLK